MLKEEWKFLNKKKMLIIVLVAIALIPSIYCYLYLSSMWNTYGKMDHIPVAIVNYDKKSSLPWQNNQHRQQSGQKVKKIRFVKFSSGF